MSFGTALGTKKAMKRSLQSGGSSPITYIPKDSELTVRFLQEPIEWFMFNEVWDDTIRKGYPLPNDPDMPGYDDSLRKATRYIANAVIIGQGQSEPDRAVVLQLPKVVVDQLFRMFEKRDTLLDRNYEIERSGAGIDTSYYTTPGEVTDFDSDSYELQSLEEALKTAYMNVWGDEVSDDDDEPAEPVRVPARPKARRRLEDEAIDDDDDDEDDATVDIADEDDLGVMTVQQLRILVREGGGDPKGMNKAAMIKTLVDKFAEDF